MTPNEKIAVGIVPQACHCTPQEDCAPCDLRDAIEEALAEKDRDAHEIREQRQEARQEASRLRDNLEHADRFGRLMAEQRDQARQELQEERNEHGEFTEVVNTKLDAALALRQSWEAERKRLRDALTQYPGRAGVTEQEHNAWLHVRDTALKEDGRP